MQQVLTYRSVACFLFEVVTVRGKVICKGKCSFPTSMMKQFNLYKNHSVYLEKNVTSWKFVIDKSLKWSLEELAYHSLLVEANASVKWQTQVIWGLPWISRENGRGWCGGAACFQLQDHIPLEQQSHSLQCSCFGFSKSSTSMNNSHQKWMCFRAFHMTTFMALSYLQKNQSMGTFTWTC